MADAMQFLDMNKQSQAEVGTVSKCERTCNRFWKYNAEAVSKPVATQPITMFPLALKLNATQ